MAKHHLDADAYVELYQFFQSRADDIKAALFSSVTWIVGFAAAVLGFVVTTFVDLAHATPRQHTGLAIVFSAVGCALCTYALLLLYDGAHHIRANWKRAELCAEHIAELPGLTLNGGGRRSFGKVWHHMGGIIALFLASFIVLIVVFATS